MAVEETVARFFELLNERNLEQLGESLAENAEFYFPKTQPLIGKERILRFFNILFRQYPVLTFRVRRTVIQGTWAAIHWTNQGRSRKDLPYENEGVTLLELEEDRIRWISDFFKDTEQF
jgi:ketosteroid isomerase-like protein